MNNRQPVTNRVSEPQIPRTQDEVDARRAEQASQRRSNANRVKVGVAIGAVAAVATIAGARAVVDRETEHQEALRQQTAPLARGLQERADTPVPPTHPDTP